ncbi:MFS transporter [Actinomycetota bacterium]|nr:MFS transporter [Actinomycetota bacterium]
MSTTPPSATVPPDVAAPPAVTPRRLVLIMVSLVLALIPLQLDALVAATALPTIAGDLGGFADLAWIATAYLLAMAVGTVVSGRLGDMFGRRRLLLLGLAVFGAASLLTGIAPSMGALIATRALQGLGAGMTFTSLLAVVADVVPPDRRARYQGVMGAIAPFSMLVGPWVGGIITEHLGWRWIFLLNVPLIAISALGVLTFVRLPVRPAGGRVDVAGLGAVTVASSGLVLAATWGGHRYDWLSWQVLGAALVAAVAIAVLVAVERRAALPVLPLDLFRNRSVVLSFVILGLGMGAVMTAATNYIPLFLQLVQGRSASSSGLLLLPLLLPAIAVALVTGRWTTTAARFRPALILGTALMVAACALLATMTTGTSGWVTAGYQVLAGLGIGLLFQTPMVLVQNASPAAEVGAATGAAGFMRMIGAAVGAGALGALFTGTVSGALPAGGIDAANLSPEQVEGLSAPMRETVRAAVASGSSALFWTAAVVSGVALAAAVALPRMRAAVAEAGPVGAATAEADAPVEQRRA